MCFIQKINKTLSEYKIDLMYIMNYEKKNFSTFCQLLERILVVFIISKYYNKRAPKNMKYVG